MENAGGSKNLLEELYLSNHTIMLKTAGRIAPSGWAEDAVHDAFLRISNNIEKFIPLSCNERRYLCVSIVRNVALNMLRDSRPRETLAFDETLAGAASVEGDVLSAERLSCIERCIAMLEPALRDVIDLRLALGYSTEETAALLGISREAVRTRLHRGRAKLREILGREGITLE
jgi:RNA polymerase sigma-70 factor (ECF subfamily)